MEPKTWTALIVLAGLWIAEAWAPFYPFFRGSTAARLRHDARCLTLGLVNAGLHGLLYAGAILALDRWASAQDFGLVRRLDHLPVWASTVIGLLAFDFWMYWWHRANHRIPWLWRLHRMHHSDPTVDATSALRFHTGEILLSGAARLVVLPIVGLSIPQLLLYESILLPVILFHHSNVRFPRALDRGLLALLVTPAMHRVHHSRVREETDSNYGSILPYWDLLFRTFRLRQDASTIRVGLEGFDESRHQTLPGLLMTPLRPRNPPPSRNTPT